MRILIAPDKLKGSLSAPEAAEAIAAGVRAAMPHAVIDLCPVSDGGEGFLRAIASATAGAEIRRVRVVGPLAEQRVEADFALLPATDARPVTAVVEMALASGLALVSAGLRNPLHTTTFGTGQLLAAAARAGARHILLGIGGSATNDAGVGAAQGAGLTVLLRDGSQPPASEPLTAADLDSVLYVKHGRGSPVDGIPITVACDVSAPLYGPSGAARVFAPQKGASPADVERLDAMLADFAGRTGQQTIAATPGAGAAGGLGFGMMAFFGATLSPGIDLVLAAVDFAARVRGADLVLTAEGSIDASTSAGKAPLGVARHSTEAGVPCVALAGRLEGQVPREFTAAFAIAPGPVSLEESQRNAAAYLAATAANVVLTFAAGRGGPGNG